MNAKKASKPLRRKRPGGRPTRSTCSLPPPLEVLTSDGSFTCSRLSARSLYSINQTINHSISITHPDHRRETEKARRSEVNRIIIDDDAKQSRAEQIGGANRGIMRGEPFDQSKGASICASLSESMQQHRVCVYIKHRSELHTFHHGGEQIGYAVMVFWPEQDENGI